MTGLYFRVCHYDFVCWDDDINVYNNRYLLVSDWRSLPHFWLHPYESLYIPLAYTYFYLVSLLAHARGLAASSEFATTLNPHVFHAASLILHALNSLLLFHLIRRTVKSDVPAAIGALLFALHPLQVESVAWISEARGLLSGAFVLSSLLCYAHIREGGAAIKRASFAGILFFALALLAKPSAAATPLVLLIWDTFYYKDTLKDSVIRLFPWFMLAAFDIAVTHFVQPMSQVVAVPMAERGIVMADSLGFYIEKLFWPFNLATEYGRSPGRMLSQHWEVQTVPWIIGAVAVIAAFGRSRRWPLVCFLTFAAFLLPMSGLFAFTYQYFSTVADRYAYLAMLGPSFTVAFFLEEQAGKKTDKIAACVCLCVLILLSIRTTAQISTWRNTSALFSNVLLVNSYDWLPHEKLGYEEMRAKNYSAAEVQFRTVIARGPQDPKFWVELGYSVQSQNRFADAERAYNHALGLSPTFALAYYRRAQCEAVTGLTSAAIQDYRTAIATLPEGSYADYELAMVLGSVGRLPEAAAEFNRTVQVHPDLLPAYYYLALTYAKIGHPELAQAAAKAALARNPNYTPVYPFLSTSAAPTHSSGV